MFNSSMKASVEKILWVMAIQGNQQFEKRFRTVALCSGPERSNRRISCAESRLKYVKENVAHVKLHCLFAIFNSVLTSIALPSSFYCSCPGPLFFFRSASLLPHSTLNLDEHVLLGVPRLELTAATTNYWTQPGKGQVVIKYRWSWWHGDRLSSSERTRGIMSSY